MKKKILLIVIALIITYLFASSIINNDKYKFIKIYFPSEIKQTIKYYLFPHQYQKEISDKNNVLQNKIYEYFYNSNITFNLKKHEEYRKIRSNILEYFILDEDQVKISRLSEKKNFLKKYEILANHNDYEIYQSKYYEIYHYAILDKSNDNCSEKKLYIFSSGHGYDPIESEEYLTLKSAMLDKCYDFLTLNMTGVGINQTTNREFDFPSKIPGANPFSHNEYFTYFDIQYPEKKPMSLILSGNYFLIKKILSIKDYSDDVIMSGFSGGGWYATVLPSIITDIKKSYSISGTLPLVYRSYLNNSGQDEENINFEFLKNSNYIDLYYLSTLDDNFISKRTHFQIYGKNDLYYEARFAELFKKSFLLKNFKIVIDDNSLGHKLNPKLLIQFLEN